ncbi:MAG TPA: tail fiber domain-containing protein [Bacteroidales bacterium]|nr:tail fiber domain-containing protein [Bacteroidales bacterium]
MRTTIAKIIFSVSFLLITGFSLAQVPHAFNYQAVARDVSGNVLPDKILGIRVSLHLGTAMGAVVYSETFTAITNAYGLFTLDIGLGTTISGQFDTIAWGKNHYYMQVEMDPTGGATYIDMGTSQLLSVPYAMYAENSAWKRNGSNIFYDAGNVGVGLADPSQKLHIKGTFRVDDPNPMIQLIDTTAFKGYVQSYHNDMIFANANDTGSIEFWTNYAEKMKIKANGNVGIGTTNPANKFEVINSESAKFRVGTITSLGKGFGQEYDSITPGYFIAHGGEYWHFCYADTPDSAYTRKVTLDGRGNMFRPSINNVISLGNLSYKWAAVYAVNGTIQTSDLRYKDNISDIQYGLDEVLKLRPVSYRWKDDNLNIGTGKNLGFIAQELETIVPEVVVHKQTEIDNETNHPAGEYPDTYGVKYSELIPVLVKAIQEQQTQFVKAIQEQQTQIEQLKQEIKILKGQ